MPEIVVECKPDEALVKSLGYTHKQVTHQPSKGSVFNYLKKNQNCIGIIDEDPNSAPPGNFANYKKQGKTQFDIEVYSYPDRPTKVIILKPRLEEWIIKRAEDQGINLSDYSLPSNAKQLHKVINERIPKLDLLLSELVTSEAFVYLKSLISSDNHF